MPPYRLTDLGAVNGVTGSAYSIANAVGQVVGQFDLPGGAGHAFLYDKETMKDLGTLGGGNSVADGINALGQVVGEAEVASGDKHAFLCNNGKMTDLGTLGGATSAWTASRRRRAGGGRRTQLGRRQSSFPLHRRDRHERSAPSAAQRPEVGPPASATPDKSRAGRTPRADRPTLFSLWTAPGMKDLGTLGGDHSYASYRVYAAGQVVGCSEIAGSADRHAFLYSIGAGMKDLGTLGGDKSYALGINASGEVVGHEQTRRRPQPGLPFPRRIDGQPELAG